MYSFCPPPEAMAFKRSAVRARLSPPQKLRIFQISKFLLSLDIFDVIIRRVGTQRFTGFALCLEHCTNFLAGVLGVPFVYDIKKRGKITILLIGTIYIIVDGYKANIRTWEYYLSVITHLEECAEEYILLLQEISSAYHRPYRRWRHLL